MNAAKVHPNGTRSSDYTTEVGTESVTVTIQNSNVDKEGSTRNNFVEVPLSGSAPVNKHKNVKVPQELKTSKNEKSQHRIPKRVLHFSDGVLEEYSDDDDEITIFKNSSSASGTSAKHHRSGEQGVSNTSGNPIDPSTLGWMAWFWYYTASAGSHSLSACDYLGESLANFFGITSPKYQYAIDEYHREVAEEEEEKLRAAREREAAAAMGMAGPLVAPTVSGQPKSAIGTMQTQVSKASEKYVEPSEQHLFKQLDPGELLQSMPQPASASLDDAV